MPTFVSKITMHFISDLTRVAILPIFSSDLDIFPEYQFVIYFDSPKNFNIFINFLISKLKESQN